MITSDKIVGTKTGSALPIYHYSSKFISQVGTGTIEGPGCITRIGLSATPPIPTQYVKSIDGIPFDKAKASLCGNATIRLSTLEWK